MRTGVSGWNGVSTPGQPVMTEDAMMVTFTVTALEHIEGHGRLLALATLEIDFESVTFQLQGV